MGDESFPIGTGRSFWSPGLLFFPEGGAVDILYIGVPPLSEAVSDFIGSYGHIQYFEPEGEVIRILRHIYELGKSRQIKDAYQSSRSGLPLPDGAVQKPVNHRFRHLQPTRGYRPGAEYMELHYRTIEGLEALAQVFGLSRYHFLHLSASTQAQAPMVHLNKLAIRKSRFFSLRTTALDTGRLCQRQLFRQGIPALGGCITGENTTRRGAGSGGSSHDSIIFTSSIFRPPGLFRFRQQSFLVPDSNISKCVKACSFKLKSGYRINHS